MLFPYDFFSQEIIKHKFLPIINQKVRMCHKSLKAHILGDSNALKFKRYLIIHNVILLDTFVEPWSSRTVPLTVRKNSVTTSFR